jgi:3-dehydroquinate dehydratase
MFKLIDNREFVYQWDTNVAVSIDDPRVKEAHFCNRTSDCSLVVEVKDGIANVPNIILQQNYDVKVFAYDGKATLFEQTIKVVGRTRPADYVYEETEIIRYEDISKRMNALEENLGSTVAEEVIKYMEENPVEVDLSNYYTKEEVDTAIENVEVDLTGYATEAYVNEAINNFQDAYYLSFLETPIGAENAIAATPEMIEFAEHYGENQNVCLYVSDGYNSSISSYVPAQISGLPKSRIILNIGSIDPFKAINNGFVRYYRYYLTKRDEQWTQYKETVGKLTIATKEYVDDAIANLDIPEAEVDLTNYYTKEETTKAIQDALDAIGVAEGGAY